MRQVEQVVHVKRLLGHVPFHSHSSAVVRSLVPVAIGSARKKYVSRCLIHSTSLGPWVGWVVVLAVSQGKKSRQLDALEQREAPGRVV